jgi:hypothetical protein
LWAALAYVEMNPVRAGLVMRAGDYRWSSAAAHLGLGDAGGLVDLEWWRREYDGVDWAESLGGQDLERSAELRRCTYAGRPFGVDGFVKAVSEVERPRAHGARRAGRLLSCHWTEYFGRWDHTEWKEILAAVLPEGECQAVRRATRTGEPLGEREFVVALERQAGRRLRVRERGRPRREPQSPEERPSQGCLFAANAE